MPVSDISRRGTSQTIIRALVVLGAISVLGGCGGERTERLIDYIDPEGMVVVTKEDGAEAIKRLRPDEYVVLSNGNFLVHKSKVRTLGDYAVITAAAPVTITIDAALYVVEGAARMMQDMHHSRNTTHTVISLPVLLFK